MLLRVRHSARNLITFAIVLAVPGSIAAELVVETLSKFCPVKYDLYIFYCDGLLGFQPSFWMGQFLSDRIVLKYIAAFAYDQLPFAMIAVLVMYKVRRLDIEGLIKTMAINLAAATDVFLVPVCGPAPTFPGFPFAIPSVTPHPIILDKVANCIPSVHFSTALLISWFCWKVPLARGLSLILLSL